MTKFLLIMTAILAALFSVALLALYIQGKVYKSKLQKKEADIMARWNEMQSRQQEILNNAKQKKDSIHGAGDSDNFTRSLDILQDIANHGC